MLVSDAVRSARKKAQKARLEHKNSEDYPEFYANQPFQQEKARRNTEIRAARHVLRDAQERLAVARVSGDGVASAEEAVKAAEQALERVQPRSQRVGGRLTAELSGV